MENPGVFPKNPPEELGRSRWSFPCWGWPREKQDKERERQNSMEKKNPERLERPRSIPGASGAFLGFVKD